MSVSAAKRLARRPAPLLECCAKEGRSSVTPPPPFCSPTTALQSWAQSPSLPVKNTFIEFPGADAHARAVKDASGPFTTPACRAPPAMLLTATPSPSEASTSPFSPLVTPCSEVGISMAWVRAMPASAPAQMMGMLMPALPAPFPQTPEEPEDPEYAFPEEYEPPAADTESMDVAAAQAALQGAYAAIQLAQQMHTQQAQAAHEAQAREAQAREAHAREAQAAHEAQAREALMAVAPVAPMRPPAPRPPMMPTRPMPEAAPELPQLQRHHSEPDAVAFEVHAARMALQRAYAALPVPAPDGAVGAAARPLQDYEEAVDARARQHQQYASQYLERQGLHAQMPERSALASHAAGAAVHAARQQYDQQYEHNPQEAQAMYDERSAQEHYQRSYSAYLERPCPMTPPRAPARLLEHALRPERPAYLEEKPRATQPEPQSRGPFRPSEPFRPGEPSYARATWATPPRHADHTAQSPYQHSSPQPQPQALSFARTLEHDRRERERVEVMPELPEVKLPEPPTSPEPAPPRKFRFAYTINKGNKPSTDGMALDTPKNSDDNESNNESNQTAVFAD